MSFEGVKINKQNSGNGTGASPREMAVAISIAAAKLPAGLSHYEPHLALQAGDVAALGLNASFDANNDVLFYQQVQQFFRLAPEGRLQVIAVPDTLTVAQLVTTEAFLSALRLAKDVKALAIAVPADVTTTFGNVEAVQAMVNKFALEHRLIDSVILPAMGNAAPLTIPQYPDLRTKVAPIVSVSIAQDPAVVALDVAYAKYADWGSVLGMLAVRQISENAGSVDIINKPDGSKGNQTYPLSGVTEWLSAQLSDGKKVNALSAADKKALTDKGYIYAGGYDGFAGIYLNSSPTCVDVDSDFAYIERNAVWNAAARAIRGTLLPKVKGKVKRDPSTGYIKSTTISEWTGAVNNALEQLQASNDISGYSVYIEPKQVSTESSPIKVQATVVYDDIAHSFEVDLGSAKSV